MKKFLKKYIGVIIVILAVIAFVLLSVLTENARKAQNNLDDFKEGFVKDEYSVTVLALTTCPHCHNFKPVIEKIAKEYDLPLYWINFDSLSNEDQDNVYQIFYESGYNGSSPYIAISKGGKIVDTHTGEMDAETTLAFLKDAGAIK